MDVASRSTRRSHAVKVAVAATANDFSAPYGPPGRHSLSYDPPDSSGGPGRVCLDKRDRGRHGRAIASEFCRGATSNRRLNSPFGPPRPISTDLLIGRLAGCAEPRPVGVAGVPDADARWRPEEGSWSILEIVSHLADEEIDDFRMRTELTLRDPELPWPPIDPEGAAVERQYNEADLGKTVSRFVTARRESITWLQQLRDPDWSRTHHHKLGDIRAAVVADFNGDGLPDIAAIIATQRGAHVRALYSNRENPGWYPARGERIALRARVVRRRAQPRVASYPRAACISGRSAVAFRPRRWLP